MTPFWRAADPVDASAASEQGSLRNAVVRSERRRERRTARGRWRAMAVLAAAAFAVDQIAKWAVRQTIGGGEDWVHAGGLAIGHNRNDGIAFGLFAGSGRVVGLATAVLLPALALGLGLLARGGIMAALAGGLLLGGSTSNLVDRLVRGEVTDYIEVGLWPAFNLADVAIVCGAGLFIWVVGCRDERSDSK